LRLCVDDVKAEIAKKRAEATKGSSYSKSKLLKLMSVLDNKTGKKRSDDDRHLT